MGSYWVGDHQGNLGLLCTERQGQTISVLALKTLWGVILSWLWLLLIISHKGGHFFTWYRLILSCFSCSNFRFSSAWRSTFFWARPTNTIFPLISFPFISSTAWGKSPKQHIPGYNKSIINIQYCPWVAASELCVLRSDLKVTQQQKHSPSSTLVSSTAQTVCCFNTGSSPAESSFWAYAEFYREVLFLAASHFNEA